MCITFSKLQKDVQLGTLSQKPRYDTKEFQEHSLIGGTWKIFVWNIKHITENVL